MDSVRNEIENIPKILSSTNTIQSNSKVQHDWCNVMLLPAWSIFVRIRIIFMWTYYKSELWTCDIVFTCLSHMSNSSQNAISRFKTMHTLRVKVAEIRMTCIAEVRVIGWHDMRWDKITMHHQKQKQLVAWCRGTTLTGTEHWLHCAGFTLFLQ